MLSGLSFVESLVDRIRHRLTIFPVDLAGPWWRVITCRTGKFAAIFLTRLFVTSVRPLFFLVLGWIFTTGKFEYLLVLFGGQACVYAVDFWSKVSLYFFEFTIVHSVHYNTYRYLFQVDPINYTRHSSGTILAKVERASRAYEELLDAVYLDCLLVGSGVIISCLSLAYYSIVLALLTFVFLISIICCYGFFTKYLAIPSEKKFIKADDKVRALDVENLTQINLIRTCFATDQVTERLYRKVLKVLYKESAKGFFFSAMYSLTKFMYLMSLFIISWWMFWLMKKGEIESAMAISLILTYVRGTYEIVRIEKSIRIIIRATTWIRDLFSYLKDFGKQTYPVLQIPSERCRINLPLQKEPMCIKAQGIFFDYSPQAKIFDNHDFMLSVSSEQTNKLYGIIGPSGIGKSTFFALLGGQLRPSAGTVLINQIDIYQVDDNARRRLLALQGQVASGMRGTLKYNLLFGLPKDQKKYKDEDLIDVLAKVGLWSLFKVKKGLHTFIGEGGMSLSGGQRQRVNFANLYLRALYFNPTVILIDEPTSSLDELTEQSITQMIDVLGQRAITMVIAHRLKTIEHAVGIFDFSLLATQKEIVFYQQDELQQKSWYYRRLMEGEESLDE